MRASARKRSTRQTWNRSRISVAFSVRSSNDSRFDEELKTYDPDVVVFERFMLEEMFGWRVRKTLPNALRILDTQDLHFKRLRREREVSNVRLENSMLKIFVISKFPVVRMNSCFERSASIVRCDATRSCLRSELLELLRDKFPFVSQSKLHIAPFFYNSIQSESFSESGET